MFSSSWTNTVLSPTVWFQLMDIKSGWRPGYDIHDELIGYGTSSDLSVFVLRTMFSSSCSITELSPTVWFQLMDFKARLCPGYDIHDELTRYGTQGKPHHRVARRNNDVLRIQLSNVR